MRNFLESNFIDPQVQIITVYCVYFIANILLEIESQVPEAKFIVFRLS